MYSTRTSVRSCQDSSRELLFYSFTSLSAWSTRLWSHDNARWRDGITCWRLVSQLRHDTVSVESDVIRRRHDIVVFTVIVVVVVGGVIAGRVLCAAAGGAGGVTTGWGDGWEPLLWRAAPVSILSNTPQTYPTVKRLSSTIKRNYDTTSYAGAKWDNTVTRTNIIQSTFNYTALVIYCASKFH